MLSENKEQFAKIGEQATGKHEICKQGIDKQELLSKVDHTLLNPGAKLQEIICLCEEAIVYKTASVCIPPSYVQKIRELFPEHLNICTVIGFPLGYNSKATKLFEASQALADGADEFDMVINITDVKNGEFDKVTDEIKSIKALIGNKILKVIVETCYLTEEEKIALCKAVTLAGADYIKTSTGFGSGGAKLSDIALFKANIGENVKIKAAGGIKTVEDLIRFIEAGCERIGSSSAVKLLK